MELDGENEGRSSAAVYVKGVKAIVLRTHLDE